MQDFPKSTQFGKKIAKQKFYEHAYIPPAIRHMFVDEIEAIIWSNKFSAETLNIAAGEKVAEIELLRIVLRQKAAGTVVLETIAKAIPYQLVFLLEFAGQCQLRIAYLSADGKRLWYQTEWQPYESLPLALQGLDLDAVYENFVRQIAGDSLPDSGRLEKDAALGKARSALQKRIAALAKKVVIERQFKRQVEYNQQLRKLRAELARLEAGGENDKNER